MNDTADTNLSNFGNFALVDYVVFLSTLIISSSIGVYFGYFEKSNKSTEEYLLGGRNMKVIPIAISLIASQLSGVSIMTIPAEIFAYGTQYFIMVPSMILTVITISVVFLPVFYNNHISNCYEYLETRFNKNVRTLITVNYLFNYLLFIPIIMFVPALAFAQVTGMDVHLINLIVSAVCIIYTTLGGIKAVVWTDVFQATVMLGSCLVVLIIAIVKMGGLSEIWRISGEGNHLEFFNMKLDLTTRHTFWNTVFGYSSMWTVYVGLSQSCVQRLIALPSLKKARFSMLTFYIGYVIIMTISCFTGLTMYTVYADCDPIKAGVVDKTDKMIPYFVQSIAGNISGMPGLFISCVFSAALSTMSANLNSLAGLIYNDFVSKMKLFKNTDAYANTAIKILVVVLGIFSMSAGFLVAKFTHLMQLISVIAGIFQGTTGGVFLLGMLWPYSNSNGSFIGGLVGLVCMAVIVIGTQIKESRGELGYPRLPASIEGCEEMGINVISIITNSTNVASMVVNDMENSSFSIFKISFAWYTALGTVITFITGVIGSSITGGPDYSKLHPRLFSPIIHRWLPEKIIRNDISIDVSGNVNPEHISLVEKIKK